MASDFHTHFSRPGINFLRSATLPATGELTSLELHPWHLPERFIPATIPQAEFLSAFTALGEIGLDRLRGPELAVQQKYLYEFFSLAADTDKPVVLHIVRCFPELLQSLKAFNLKVMLHGFRSSPELLDELWKRNITVSFSPTVTASIELMQKLKNPAGPFGFESDDRLDTDVRQVIERTAAATGLQNLEQITDQYFADFTGI